MSRVVHCFASGAVRQRESTEHCTRDLTTPASGSPSRDPVTQELESQDQGAVLALLAATLAQSPPAPRVEAAFHCRLRRDVQVERRALHELGVYYLVSGDTAGWAEQGGTYGDLICVLCSPKLREPSAGAQA